MTQFGFRFVRAAQLPDELEMLLDEQRLSVSGAPAMLLLRSSPIDNFVFSLSLQHFVPVWRVPTTS